MILMHPICLTISLCGALSYTLYLFGWQAAKRGIRVLLPVMLLAAVINPAFSHQGVTVLTYLPSGNVLTLESILYGMAAACMLGATLLWFRTAGEILTADDFVYLFGKGFPVLGLILSMILGFIPKIQKKYTEIRTAGNERRKKEEQRVEERYGGGKPVDKMKLLLVERILPLRQGIEYLSILITWVLEDAVNMADSMKGRGYGLEGRTAYTLYRFTGRDKKMLAALLLAVGYVLLGYGTGGLAWAYFPQTEGALSGAYSVSIYLVYLWMCMLPVTAGCIEEKKWRRLKSGI